ncbi:protein transport protein Sec16B [Xyrichtys novacula]|uniref:Protein transport protein sec16 n=1 Tax=Xyrichtys novacula TaxID=13765 RepID=A0AAV1FFD4_XYRNO|nr:protein transport protein Sec16B [Xyrichtys novacula]
MDHRGHPRQDSGRHPQRTKDREDYYRYSQQDGHQGYPPPDPRDRDRHRAPSDAPYRSYYTSPPARPEQHPYNSQQYHYGYGHVENQRPQSRHGYSHWDYRDPYDHYGYYDHDYYRGQYARQDHANAGQWGTHDQWITQQYHDRPYRPEHSGSSNPEDYRYDHGRDNSQHYSKDYEDNPSRDNEEDLSYYPGTLESSKNSGMSSSSYELSQYINGAEHSESVFASDAVHQMSAPLKFSIPHAVVSFGPAGQLIRVSPGLSTQESISQVEIHSMEVVLSETVEQQEMRNFPGPLVREDLHKVDAIEFAHQRAGDCMRDDKLHDKRSAALLWNLLILLCRQNGQIVGSDIAELLMQGSNSDGSWEKDAPTLIDFSEGSTAEEPLRKGDDLLTGNLSSSSSETSVKALQNYTKLLLAGRKKEALESAMSSGLWGHALFLASKMDNRSYTTVLNRFTGQLTASDPLQTMFQLLSGRTPAVAMCYADEKWGDWKPHLAVMLSNETGDPAVQQRAIMMMGDTLASKGLMHAAHMCYLTAGVPFGVFPHKAERLVLLGSSHRLPFQHFAMNSAIQCTELYEYCQTLGGKSFFIPTFQVYKFLYACRLLDCGLSSQAFHYCEVVGQSILRQKEPFFVLTGEVIKLSDRLRHSEGQFGEAGVSGEEQEPNWLKYLRARLHSLQTGTYDCTDTYQPEGKAVAHEDSRACSESDLHDIQSPVLELLYRRDSEDQVNPWHQDEGNPEEMTASSWDSQGAQYWPPANHPMPVTEVYTPQVLAVAAGQDFSYHNTDSAEVKTALPHCSQNNLPSSAEGSSLGESTMGGQIPQVTTSQLGQSQQSIPQHLETSESSKGGWFSGWFKSKPKDVPNESTEPGGAAQTMLPPSAGFAPPPPPASAPPGMFQPQSTSAGINPFSRKAGQQLGSKSRACVTGE